MVDAWMETCLVAIGKIGYPDVQFAALTETVDIDIGEKGIEGLPLTSGGRVTKFNAQGDHSVTFEAYPLEAGNGRGFFDLVNSPDLIVSSTTTATTSNKLTDTNVNFTTLGVAAGDKIINTTDNTSAIVSAVDSATALSISSDIMASGEKYLLFDTPLRVTNDRNRDKYRVLILWTDKAAILAGEAIANTYNALRIGLVEGYFTSVKPSFTDGILKFTVVYKTTAFDKSASGNAMVESCAAAGGSDALPAIAQYTTINKFG